MSDYVLKSNWIEIDTKIIDFVNEDTDDIQFCFEYENEIYFLSNFLRTHNNPWINDDYPEYIHGVQGDAYYNPLLIEIDDSGDNVRVYQSA